MTEVWREGFAAEARLSLHDPPHAMSGSRDSEGCRLAQWLLSVSRWVMGCGCCIWSLTASPEDSPVFCFPVQLFSVMSLCSDVSALESAGHGLKLWANQASPPLNCWHWVGNVSQQLES